MGQRWICDGTGGGLGTHRKSVRREMNERIDGCLCVLLSSISIQRSSNQLVVAVFLQALK